MLIFTQQKCVVVNFAFDETGARLLPREGHSSFGIGNCSIDVFERMHAPATFVVFGALELSLRRTQVLEGSPHVRLIGPNRIQTSGGNYGNDSETDSQYFHPARSKQSPHQVKLRLLPNGRRACDFLDFPGCRMNRQKLSSATQRFPPSSELPGGAGSVEAETNASR
jgi:hypothetical protein